MDIERPPDEYLPIYDSGQGPGELDELGELDDGSRPPNRLSGQGALCCAFAASVRGCETVGWQAKAPAPRVNPAVAAIFSRLVCQRFPGSTGFIVRS
ncbi:MAG: hypothetical protein ACLQU1_00510 [Bryobacteraceae bacterium]